MELVIKDAPIATPMRFHNPVNTYKKQHRLSPVVVQLLKEAKQKATNSGHKMGNWRTLITPEGRSKECWCQKCWKRLVWHESNSDVLGNALTESCEKKE